MILFRFILTYSVHHCWHQISAYSALSSVKLSTLRGFNSNKNCIVSIFVFLLVLYNVLFANVLRRQFSSYIYCSNTIHIFKIALINLRWKNGVAILKFRNFFTVTIIVRTLLFQIITISSANLQLTKSKNSYLSVERIGR